MIKLPPDILEVLLSKSTQLVGSLPDATLIATLNSSLRSITFEADASVLAS